MPASENRPPASDSPQPQGVIACTWSPDPEALGDRELRWILSRWHSARVRAPVPAETWIEPGQFRAATSDVMLFDRTPDGHDARIRLIGSRLAELIGHELTGALLSERPREIWIGHQLRWLVGECARRRQPCLAEIVGPSPQGAVLLTALLLPVANPDRKVARLAAIIRLGL